MDIDQSTLSAVATGAGTGAITGLSVAWVAKVAIQRWLSRQEKDSEILRTIDKDQAVLKHRLETLEKDINKLGATLRASLAEVKASLLKL